MPSIGRCANLSKSWATYRDWLLRLRPCLGRVFDVNPTDLSRWNQTRRICTFHRRFALGKIAVQAILLSTSRSFRAISADRRGIEPDSYVFEVPEHEEAPLGPLTLNDRRGNLRKQNSFRNRWVSISFLRHSSFSLAQWAFGELESRSVGSSDTSSFGSRSSLLQTQNRQSRISAGEKSDHGRWSPPTADLRKWNAERTSHLLDSLDGQPWSDHGEWSHPAS